MPDLQALGQSLQVGLEHYLTLSVMLFSVGTLGVIFRRNALVMFMSVELMLSSVNISLIAFSRYLDDLNGHVLVLFVLAVAAAEAGVGLAILVEIFKKRDSVDVDEFRQLME
jgi:NADH-quinone oxidoreductase subunit K